MDALPEQKRCSGTCDLIKSSSGSVISDFSIGRLTILQALRVNVAVVLED